MSALTCETEGLKWNLCLEEIFHSFTARYMLLNNRHTLAPKLLHFFSKCFIFEDIKNLIQYYLHKIIRISYL